MIQSLVKVAVLVLSIGLGAGYVWRSSRKAPAAAPPPAAEAESAAKSPAVVTDEEVASMREMMLKSSKSGAVMTDQDIRKMLENRQPAEAGEDSSQELMPSSKMGFIISKDDLRETGTQPLFPKAPEVPKVPEPPGADQGKQETESAKQR